MEIGDKIPDNLGINQNGKTIKSSDYKGKKIILYFYPKDMTSGCTAQACSLRDNYKNLKELGYEIIGVSIDSVARHQKFIEQNNLPFTLISDTEHSLTEFFGVWGEKKMYGKSYMGTIRTTFIFNDEGILTHKISGKAVNTKEHAEQIFELVK